jgi:hypothetical protein
MIKFVEYPDGVDAWSACQNCAYGGLLQKTANDCGHFGECCGGLFADVPDQPREENAPNRRRQRKSTDRRLLEALLKCLDLSEDGVFSGNLVNISAGNQLKLLAVKKALQKGGGK